MEKLTINEIKKLIHLYENYDKKALKFIVKNITVLEIRELIEKLTINEKN